MLLTILLIAGFLLKVPSEMVNSYPHKIINLHPSLLPKYGGRGMYGINVHRAVIKNKETERVLLFILLMKNMMRER